MVEKAAVGFSPVNFSLGVLIPPFVTMRGLSVLIIVVGTLVVGCPVVVGGDVVVGGSVVGATKIREMAPLKQSSVVIFHHELEYARIFLNQYLECTHHMIFYSYSACI